MLRRAEPALALAYGELSARDEAELVHLMEQIQADAGFFCGGYKDRCLRRRLAIRMRARGVQRYRDYAALLRRDAAEYEKLLSVLVIHVSKFFRNHEVWQVIAAKVVPALFALDAPRLRIWSAGSAGGEEAYSIAILLQEHARRHGLGARLDRFEVLGIDIDRDILEQARRAEYSEAALVEVPPELRRRWFVVEGGTYRPREEVRRMVSFERLDLLTEPLPREQHLILCRNVMIYFERSVQGAFMERLRASLAPGGYLVLGQAETIPGALARDFRAISQRERVYKCL